MAVRCLFCAGLGERASIDICLRCDTKFRLKARICRCTTQLQPMDSISISTESASQIEPALYSMVYLYTVPYRGRNEPHAHRNWQAWNLAQTSFVIAIGIEQLYRDRGTLPTVRFRVFVGSGGADVLMRQIIGRRNCLNSHARAAKSVSSVSPAIETSRLNESKSDVQSGIPNISLPVYAFNRLDSTGPDRSMESQLQKQGERQGGKRPPMQMHAKCTAWACQTSSGGNERNSMQRPCRNFGEIQLEKAKQIWLRRRAIAPNTVAAHELPLFRTGDTAQSM